MEEMLDRRGIDVSCETIRSWTVKLGPKIAASLQRRKLPPSSRSHLDEMVCKIGGERVFLWRAVDDEGDEPDLVVQKRRDTRAARELLQQ
ncbi:MAG: DDE-type integrase/transposase/recombinase [Hyphomonadaceae bacterium]|nr:DDE-type integrase/transposase/recombinase [Hyphomonadaceae bacterium]